MIFKSISIALAATTMSFASVASASTPEPVSTSVVYADLDLTSAEGIAELDRRINQAARQVCGLDQQMVGSRLRGRDARACFVQARRQLEQHFADLRGTSGQPRG